MISFQKSSNLKAGETQQVKVQDQLVIGEGNMEQEEKMIGRKDEGIVRDLNKQLDDNIFPTAKEMLEMTKKKWMVLTAEEVLKRIKSASNLGERSICFSNCIIPKTTIEALKRKEYIVEDSFVTKTPYVKVEW